MCLPLETTRPNLHERYPIELASSCFQCIPSRRPTESSTTARRKARLPSRQSRFWRLGREHYNNCLGVVIRPVRHGRTRIPHHTETFPYVPPQVAWTPRNIPPISLGAVAPLLSQSKTNKRKIRLTCLHIE